MGSDGETLEVAITGEGVAPRTVQVATLARLLSASGAALVAAADALHVPPVHAALVTIKKGSAAYRLETPPAPVESSPAHFVYDAAIARGRGVPAPLRKALKDIHAVGLDGAGIRLSVLGREPRPQIMLAPIEDEEAEAWLEEVDEVYGVLVGLDARQHGGGARVKLRLEQGRLWTFAITDDALADRAGTLWRKSVKARVVFRRSATGAEEPVALEEIEPHSEIDFFAVIEALRRDIKESGIIVDADAWLDDAEGD